MAIKVSNIVVVDNDKNLANINSATFIGTTSIKVPSGTTGEKPVGTPGEFRFNTTDNAFEGYTNAWGSIGSGGVTDSFANSTIEINSNTTANIGFFHILTANATLTLPPNPTINSVILVSNRSGYANSVIARNGKNIMRVPQDLYINIINVGFTLIYTDINTGWTIK